MKNIIKSYIKIGVIALFAMSFVIPVISDAQSVPASCSVGYTEDLVGKTVTWTATSDIPGTFSWSGTDGLSGSGSTATISYSTEGTKTASIDFDDGLGTTYMGIVCSNDVTIYAPENTPALSASCMPNISSAVIGQPVTWNASISGGLAPYSIIWNGDEYPGAWSGSVAEYSATGTKSAEMATIESRYGSETATLSNIACGLGVPVYSQESMWLSASEASCSADKTSSYTNDSVSWTVSGITGGTAPYKIYWEGTDGLSENSTSISKTYSSTGNKTALVYSIESSDGQSIDVNINCSNSVDVSNRPGGSGGSSLIGSCSANISDAKIGDLVIWTTQISGGIAPYTFIWSGSESLSGSEASTTKIYTQVGTATSSVKVKDSRQVQSDIDLNCTPINISAASSTDNGGGSSTTTATTTPDTNGGTTGTTTATTTPPSGNTGQENNGGRNVTEPFIFNNDLQLGDRIDPDVLELQKRLTAEGVYVGAIGGYFGPLTEESVRAYQTQKGLEANGKIDCATRNALNGTNEFCGNSNATTTASSTEGTVQNESLLAATVGLFTGNWLNLVYLLAILIGLGLIIFFIFFFKREKKEEIKKTTK